MEKYPEHNMTCFYKYSSIDTSKIILTARKFRYSSPLLFNDPFDTQTELVFDYDINSFPEKLLNEMIRIASMEKLPNFKMQSEWTQIIELLRKRLKKENSLEQELKDMLLANISVLKDKMEETRKNYNKLWSAYLIPIRVFSVSEKNDEILMWSHYAKNHTGIVFKLRVLPEIDNLLCAAEPVIYKPKPLVFHTLQEWFDDILGMDEIKYDDIFRKYARVKYDIWKYEAEWRVWSFEWNSTDKLYNDYNIRPQELEAIYFGCNADKDDIILIKQLAKEINSSVVFLKASKIIGEYKLKFDEI